MITSQFYRVRPNYHFGAMPNGGSTAGTQITVYSSTANIETRFSVDGSPIGCLESEAAFQERLANGTAVLDALAVIVGRNGLDCLPIDSPRMTLVAQSVADSTTGPIAARIAATTDGSPAQRLATAKALLGLLVDVA